MIAAAVCVCTCGPSSVIDRTGPTGEVATERPDARPGARPDGPINLPPMQPPNNQPPGTIDPIGFAEGFNCKADKECRLGHCSDGVCCLTACDGVCESCKQPGNLGRCLPVPEGEDPDEECAEEGPASCGQDGVCGVGACRRYPAGTVCAPRACEMAMERSERQCDGNGACVPGTIKSCAPAECIGDACAPPCAMDKDCPDGRWCDSGTCRPPREQGAPCERNPQCGSGFCTDGVCCNTACAGTCQACNLQGAVGMCTPVPSGQDPGAECPVQPIGTCGNAGGCNGQGACRKHPMGTWCAHGSCMNGTQYGNSTCDGMGGCRRGPGRSCGLYACNGNLVCWSACANNAQCAPGRTCNIHACQ